MKLLGRMLFFIAKWLLEILTGIVITFVCMHLRSSGRLEGAVWPHRLVELKVSLELPFLTCTFLRLTLRLRGGKWLAYSILKIDQYII